MRPSHLLTIAAIVELGTGCCLMLFPDAIATLLFSQGLSGAGLVVGRLTGIALIALGLACWGARHSVRKNSIATAMLAYNGLAAVYLARVGMDDGLTGSLLWPAIGIHATLALFFAYFSFSHPSH